MSVERITGSGVDDEDNWTASTCPSGSSPATENCVSASTETSISDYDVALSEIMSNPLDEATGEFVEIYNAGADTVDLLYMVLWDGDAADTVFGWHHPYDPLLEPGAYALILDADYAGDYPDIPGDTLILTTDDSTLGSGLATTDEVVLLENDAYTIIDSFSHPLNPGNGVSAEKIDLSGDDEAANWAASDCAAGSSPGAPSCF